MTARDRWGFVPFEPSPETVIRIGWISAAVGFLIAIVSAVGEVFGWWNDLGEIGITVGSLLGIIATFTSLTFTAGRGQVASIQESLGSVEESIWNVDAVTQENSETLQDNNRLLGEATVSLEGIQEALVAEDGQASKLDVVQTELDRQTGVLDRQIRVLEQIRDGA